MNRDLRNRILEKVVRQGDVLNPGVTIWWSEQEQLIDVTMFQNPVTYKNDFTEQSVYASERIAQLVNSFCGIDDVEELYATILEGLEDMPSLLQSNALRGVKAYAVQNMALETNMQYLELVKNIKKKRCE